MSKSTLPRARGGPLVIALLEDKWNKTADVRPRAQEVTNQLADVLAAHGDVVNPGFVENEDDARRAARQFNAEEKRPVAPVSRGRLFAIPVDCARVECEHRRVHAASCEPALRVLLRRRAC